MNKIILALIFSLPLSACAKKNDENCGQDAQCYYQIAQGKYNKNKFYTPEIFHYFEESAKLDNDLAQLRLGLVYSEKDSKYYNYKKAKFWLNKQNNKNHDAAYFLAQLIYERGNLSLQDYEEIEENLKYASQGGNLDAFRDLSMLYFYAPTDKKNLNKAFKYSVLAAEKNIPEAQYILATFYDFGIKPADQNYAKAYYYYSKSAEQGYVKSINNLGVMYAKGQGVDKNEARAIELFNEAYALEDTEAMLNLGDAYLKGILGVKQNISLAKKYFEEAKSKGNVKADIYLNLIE